MATQVFDENGGRRPLHSKSCLLPESQGPNYPLLSVFSFEIDQRGRGGGGD